MDALTELPSEIHPAGVTPEWRERLEERVLRPLANTGPRYVLWLTFLLGVVGWAVYAYTWQLDHGLLVTGMRDRISWGVYIASFVFFIGISHAGTLLSAILRVVKARWQLSITRMAEFITCVALMVGALFPFIDMGRPERILNLLFYGRWQSPLLWDIVAISTYLTGSTLYLFLPLVPDFALCRDRLGPRAPAWKRWFFTAAALGWTGSPRQRQTLERAMTVMMCVIIPVAVSVHTVVSWIFAMSLRDPLNTTVFGPFFVAGAIYSGIAAIILLMWVLRWLLHLEEYITQRQFVNLGYLLGAFALIMSYMNIQEYAVTSYKMAEGTLFHIGQLTVGPFAVLFWFYIIGGLLVPGLIILLPRTRTVGGIVVAAVLIEIAMWLERYLIVVAGFRVPTMPYDPRMYSPSWVEWSILAGAFALFALIITVFAKLFPVVSVWEVVEHRGPEPPTAPARLRLPTRRAAVAIATLVALVPGAALAQAAPATIDLHVPTSSSLGESVTIQARVVDASGAAVTGATLSFSIPSLFFLGTAADAMLGQAITDEQGLATFEYEPRITGDLIVQADFAGNERVAAASARGAVSVADDPSQLYVERAGVRIPGLNSPPVGPTTAEIGGSTPLGLGRLWPMLSAWPLMLVLVIIWSLYAFVVKEMFGLAMEPALAPARAAGPRPVEEQLKPISLAPIPTRSRFVFPAVAALGVLGISAMLLTIIARSPYTHTNLLSYVGPSYTRTDQIEVGPPMLHAGRPFADTSSEVTSQDPPGQLLLIAHGCAGCHGMDGQGATVGPAIMPDVQIVRQTIRNGPHGMPVFSPQEVTDEDVAAIVAFLQSVSH